LISYDNKRQEAKPHASYLATSIVYVAGKFNGMPVFSGTLDTRTGFLLGPRTPNPRASYRTVKELDPSEPRAPAESIRN
jgi:hypothetical protein